MEQAASSITQQTLVRPAEAERQQEVEVGQTQTLDFVEVLDRFESPLLRYVTHVLGSNGGAADPEDIVQETFLRLHRQIEQKGAESILNLQSWLFRVAHNLALDVCRRRDRERKAKNSAREESSNDSSENQDALDGLAEMVRREACDRAMEELQRLPEEEKHVILLKVVHGMTLREIGEITGLTTGNVDYRIKRGLAALARRLKEGGII